MSDQPPEEADMADLIAEISELEQFADSDEERQQIQETLAVARTVDRGGLRSRRERVRPERRRPGLLR